jgi:hypothetical protein
VNIRFACPACDAPGSADLPGPAEWHCLACGHPLRLPPATDGGALTSCAVCGNHELYRKKDFPHGLGMTLLGLACLGWMLANWLYHQWLAWVILGGSAALDLVLYLWVGDVVVCYRCNAHHRGFAPNPEHRPHELATAERYRQERIRREQFGAEKK